MAKLKNIITLVGIASAAGGGSTLAFKDSAIMQTVQASISSLQDSVIANIAPTLANLAPEIEKVLKNNK